jgi:hypothetical protein
VQQQQQQEPQQSTSTPGAASSSQRLPPGGVCSPGTGLPTGTGLPPAAHGLQPLIAPGVAHVQVAPVPASLQPFLQQLGAFSTAWGQQPQGGAMPPPLGMPQSKRAQSLPGGPRVLWWWPCRPLDRVNAKCALLLSTCTCLGLGAAEPVQVSIWALAPTPAQLDDLQPAGPCHWAQPAAAAAAAAGVGALVDAAAQGSRPGGCVTQQGAVSGLEGLAHDRVSGSWRQLESFTGKLYVRNGLQLGPPSAVQHLRDYEGWHLLRAELVREG